MAASLFAEAELHSLVDGRIAPAIRADVLRRLAASPTDRMLVETWQEQADLVRDAFRDVAAEPLPVALDLAAPRLRSVDPDRGGKVATPATPARHGNGAAITAALLITIGLTLSWMAGSRDDAAVSVPARAATAPDTDGGALPSFKVPDLSSSGLRLTDVSSDAAEPTTVVLRYRDNGAGRVALKVARNVPDVGALPLEHAGKTLTWRSPTAAFTLGGTLPPGRLAAVATALQADTGSD